MNNLVYPCTPLRSALEILERLASEGGQDVEAFVKRPRPSEGVPGGFTVDGFLRLIQLFIDKKQVILYYIVTGKGGWENSSSCRAVGAEGVLAVDVASQELSAPSSMSSWGAKDIGGVRGWVGVSIFSVADGRGGVGVSLPVYVSCE